MECKTETKDGGVLHTLERNMIQARDLYLIAVSARKGKT
jgi:hypothetical protein